MSPDNAIKIDGGSLSISGDIAAKSFHVMMLLECLKRHRFRALPRLAKVNDLASASLYTGRAYKIGEHERATRDLAEWLRANGRQSTLSISEPPSNP